MLSIASHLSYLTHRRHTLLTGRAAAGIYAALVALGLRGHVVGIPANTCYIVLWAVLRAGCKPLLLDIDPTTGNLPALPELQGHRLGAIIPCHLYGIPMPMAALCAWADERGIIVIEDAALALGAQADGKPMGAWGDVSVVSFGIGKIVDNGVGGAAVTDDEPLAREMARVLETMPLWDDRLIDLTNQWNALYWALHQYEYRNPRLAAFYPQLYDLYGELVAYGRLDDDDWRGLDTLLAAVEPDRQRRLRVAEDYDALLPLLGAQTLARRDDATLWKYPLLVDAAYRDDLLTAMWDAGIHNATRWYPSLQPMCAALSDMPQPPTPHADSFAARIINLELTQSSLQSLRAAVSRLP